MRALLTSLAECDQISATVEKAVTDDPCAAGLGQAIESDSRVQASLPTILSPTVSLPTPALATLLVCLAQGIVLTFYAFIGFEDTLNVAEELKNPRRNLPLGLVMALVLTVVIYMSVAISAVSVVPWQEWRAAGRRRRARGTLVPGVGAHRYHGVRGRQAAYFTR